jgi:hypothetical protein
MIGSMQRPLPDNKQHSQETDIRAAGGIGTSNPSKRAAADPRLRPRGHRDLTGFTVNVNLFPTFGVLRTVNIKDLWDVKQCTFVGRYQLLKIKF